MDLLLPSHLPPLTVDHFSNHSYPTYFCYSLLCLHYNDDYFHYLKILPHPLNFQNYLPGFKEVYYQANLPNFHHIM